MPPERLTAAERLDLHRRFKATNDRKILGKLCEQFDELAKSLTRSLCSRLRGADFEEALTDAREGVCRALEKFDETRGCKLTSFVFTVVRRSLLDFERGGPIHVPRGPAQREKKDAARQTVGFDVIGAEPLFARSTRLDALECDEIAFHLGKLRPADRTVIHELFFESRTVTEVAERSGLSKSQVATARDRSLAALRRHLTDYAPPKKLAK